MRWIPIAERLPTHPYSVLGWVTKGGLVIPNERGMRDIVTYFPSAGEWHQPVDGGDAIVDVSHWMDLPPPPGGWEPGASSDDEEAPAPEQWRPMETAPADGTIVRLLVDYSGEDACHPLEDAPITHTIGGNTDGHTGLSEGWKFAGWSWEQDCFCEGRGKPIGWLPFAPVPHGVPGVDGRTFPAAPTDGGKAAP